MLGYDGEMPRAINKLTARTVTTIQGPGRFSDGGGLYLSVDPSGARRWLFIFRSAGKQREMGLGGLSVVSLSEARRKRDVARKLLSEGRDPIDSRREMRRTDAGSITFGAFADDLVPELCKGYRNEKHAAQWMMTLRVYAAPLRPKPVDAVQTNDVLECLQPIWTEKPETASRVRGRIEHLLDAAKARGLRDGENPARWRGHLDQLLPRRRKLTRGHHAALPYSDVPAFVTALRARPAIASLALEFLILTSARTSEVLGAQWREIDTDAKLWTIPGLRMKSGRMHRVPLTERLLLIISQMQEIRRSEWIFPSTRSDRPLSNMVFNALLRRMGVSVTTHGFRSSFRDWAGEETTIAREVAEAALAHAIGNETERAYRRGDALTKRRDLMEAWSAYVG